MHKLCALRTLKGHGMDDAALQTIYRSVITAKLTNASTAWWGFTSATDRQKINTFTSFIRRSQGNRLVPPNLLPFAELCCAADDKLFQRVTTDRKHILYDLIPPPSVASQNYNLHQHRHNLELPSKSGHLRDCNFIERMLLLYCY